MVLGLVLCVCLSFSVQAEVAGLTDSLYNSIIDRNAFGLQPQPEVPVIQDTNPPPVKIDLKLTGITTTARGKKAWFMIPAQPGKKPEAEYLSILEGQSDGDIEVLEINQEGRTVRISNAGTIVSLNFKDDAAPPPVGTIPPPPVAPPGMRPNPIAAARAGATAVSPPTAVPTSQPGLGSSPRGYAGRTIDPQLAARYGLQAGPSDQHTPTVRTIPARNVRTTPIPQPEQIDPVIQAIQMKAHEQQARMEGRIYPPLPPIPGIDFE